MINGHWTQYEGTSQAENILSGASTHSTKAAPYAFLIPLPDEYYNQQNYETQDTIFKLCRQ